ncbi:MAG: FecR family protein [Spirochaetota bacterium]
MKGKKKMPGIKAFWFMTVFAAIVLLSANVFAAQISFMAGDVKVVRNGKTQSAQFQMKLESGDIVKTGKGAFADVSYDDGTVVKVTESSAVTIGNKNVLGSDSVSVTSGMIAAKFAKLEKDSARKVYTPTTVCAVRGTEFNVAVSDSADSKVQMKEGTLDVHNPYGKVEIAGNQNAEINVAKAPAQAQGGELEKWKNENESALDNNPDAKADDFSLYVKDFQKRSENASKSISDLEKKKGKAVKGTKENLEKANKDIELLEGNVEDDMYLNSAANTSIDGILNRYQKGKKGMYGKYLKVKKESNKVLDQQKRNLKAIASVKEAYRKAYDEIIGKHKESIDKIKGSFDKEQVKPKK